MSWRHSLPWSQGYLIHYIQSTHPNSWLSRSFFLVFFLSPTPSSFRASAPREPILAVGAHRSFVILTSQKTDHTSTLAEWYTPVMVKPVTFSIHQYGIKPLSVSFLILLKKISKTIRTPVISTECPIEHVLDWSTTADCRPRACSRSASTDISISASVLQSDKFLIDTLVQLFITLAPNNYQ